MDLDRESNPLYSPLRDDQGIEEEADYNNEVQPYIPAHKIVNEITIKALILSVILAIVLGAANVYLGLFAGMTVSASIPAAVMSMAILRLFKSVTILENNLVQTAASAGESLAAGIIFTIPALVVLGHGGSAGAGWDDFKFIQTTLIGCLGGTLGVMFSIPLRRAMIIEHKPPLRFPEGVATAEVLKAGEKEEGGSSAMGIVLAASAGGFVKLIDTGLKIMEHSIGVSFKLGKAAFYIYTEISPALVGVGYIVGWKIALVVLLGGGTNWLLAIPIRTSIADYQPINGTELSAADIANEEWSTQTRYLGCGAMVVGGIWALIKLRSALMSGIMEGMKTYKEALKSGANVQLRTERDLSIKTVLIVTVLCVIPLFFVFFDFTENFGVSLLMVIYMVICGFLFSAVAAYMAGLVGSSNNPISGVTICTVLIASLILRVVMGSDNVRGPVTAVFISSVVASAAAISGDNMQDLKAGQLVGATPWKQQALLVLGVVSSAAFMAPILNLLNEAYGIGVVTKKHPNPLRAPQAILMAEVAKGVFTNDLPWKMVGSGMGLAATIIVIDLYLESRKSSFRMPVLAYAVGLYLPMELQWPMLFGGLVPVIAGVSTTNEASNGILFSGGLITGEALTGVLLAIPIVISGKADVLTVIDDPLSWPGPIILILLLFWLYHIAKKDAEADNKAVSYDIHH